MDDIAADYPQSFVGEAALAKKMMVCFHEKGDVKLAENILDELKTKFPASEFIADGQALLKSAADFSLKKETAVVTSMPQKYELSNAYPNPFNPSTTVNYSLPRQSSVRVEIYNIRGQKVKEFVYSSQSAGAHRLTWNGQNRFGEKVSSGLYIIRFQAESLAGKAQVFQKAVKVIMLK